MIKISKQTKRKKELRKKNKKIIKQKRFKKYTQKAGLSKLGACYIKPYKNNLIIILGRRKYITKNFNKSQDAKDLIYKIANDPNKKNHCISIAQALDERLQYINL